MAKRSRRKPKVRTYTRTTGRKKITCRTVTQRRSRKGRRRK